jgi:hypothetical protein
MKTKTGKVSEHRVLNKKRRAREERALARSKEQSKKKNREAAKAKSEAYREKKIMRQAKRLGIKVPGKEDDVEAVYQALRDFCKTSKRHTAV